MSAALKNLDRWIYLMQQVHEARHYIGRAEGLGHPHLWVSYEPVLDFLVFFRGALNSYAKCFVSTGSGRIRLKEADLYSADQVRLTAHRGIIELRHKYVAHSDANEFEEVRVVEEPSDAELCIRLRYNILFPFDRLYELRDLIGFIEGHIVDQQRPIVERISRDVGKAVRIREGD